MKKKSVSNILWVVAILSLCALGFGVFVPSFAARSRGNSETACKSNLKNIGTALELYSTDWSGSYPTELSNLTPNYLKTIPECPVTGEMSYRAAFGPGAGYNTGTELEDGTKSEPWQNYYLIWCDGSDHNKAYGTPVNYPQYDAIQGLIEP